MDNLIYQAETIMKKLNREDKQRMSVLVKDAKQALKKKDPIAVRNSCLELERALGAAGQSVCNTEAQPIGDDGVYDATYEPVDGGKNSDDP